MGESKSVGILGILKTKISFKIYTLNNRIIECIMNNQFKQMLGTFTKYTNYCLHYTSYYTSLCVSVTPVCRICINRRQDYKK